MNASQRTCTSSGLVNKSQCCSSRSSRLREKGNKSIASVPASPYLLPLQPGDTFFFLDIMNIYASLLNQLHNFFLICCSFIFIKCLICLIMSLDFEVQEQCEWHYVLFFKCSWDVRVSTVQICSLIANSKAEFIHSSGFVMLPQKKDLLLFLVCNPVL